MFYEEQLHQDVFSVWQLKTSKFGISGCIY